MSNQRLSIRRATEDDATLIANLSARTFRDSFGFYNDPEDMQRYITLNFSLDKIETELGDPTSTFLLAHKDGEPIGYAMLRDSKKPDYVKGTKPIELVRIYVTQNHIGKGYGSALMKSCIEEAKLAGYKTIWLGVWEENHRATRFYKKWDFIKVGFHDFILGSNVQNDLILERSVE